MSQSFDTLIYTDCAPGQGLSGAGGLQFQSASAPDDGSAMAVVRQHLLYEPPNIWMQRRRPVSDYPPSFSHVFVRDRYATAAGLYLGREVNGGREGNQLTHCIVTSNLEAYGRCRPAQLHGASFWRRQPTATKESAPLPPGWQPGPFGVAQAQELVRTTQHGDDLLLRLLSALHRLDGAAAKRILFVSTDCAEVMRWIAAGTFLLPQRIAARIGFKVFTANPAIATQQILAVHPEWTTDPGAYRERGYVVFDLTNGTWDAVSPTPMARHWVGLFLTEDPFDVMDAVEVTAAVEAPFDTGRAVAMASVFHRPPADEREARLVARWLGQAQPGHIEAYGVTVVEALRSATAAWPTLIADLSVAARNGITSDPVIWLTLLRIAIRNADAFAELEGTDIGRPPAHPDRAAIDRAASAELHSALQDAEPTRFEALLRVAGSFGVPVALGSVPAATQRFIADWLEHPDRYAPERWPQSGQLVGMIADRLDIQVEQGEDVGARWARTPLAYQISAARPIGRAIIASQISGAPTSERLSLLRTWIAPAAAAAEHDGGALLAATVRSLWGRALPTPAEIDLLDQVLPRNLGIRGDWIPNFAGRILDSPDYAAPLLDSLHEGTARGTISADRQLSALLGQDRVMTSVCMELRTPTTGLVDQMVLPFAGLPLELRRARHQPLLSAMAAATHPPSVRIVLRLYPAVVNDYYDQLMSSVRGTGSAIDVVMLFYLSHPLIDALPISDHDYIERVIRDWLRRLGKRKQHIRLAGEHAAALGPPYAKQWSRLSTEEGGKKVRGPLGVLSRGVGWIRGER